MFELKAILSVRLKFLLMHFMECRLSEVWRISLSAVSIWMIIRCSSTGSQWQNLLTFLESFRQRYGRQISTVSADSGYGCEMNYGYMVSNQIALFVRYNMFHVEMKAWCIDAEGRLSRKQCLLRLNTATASIGSVIEVKGYNVGAEMVAGMKSELFRRNQARFTLPPLSSNYQYTSSTLSIHSFDELHPVK